MYNSASHNLHGDGLIAIFYSLPLGVVGFFLSLVGLWRSPRNSGMLGGVALGVGGVFLATVLIIFAL